LGLCLLLPLFIFASVAAAETSAVRFSPRTKVQLVDQKQGQELIARRDDFTKALSRFDVQSRLKTNRDVTPDDLLTLYADNVTDWPADDAANVTAALEAVRDALKAFDVPLPETVFIVRTTGREESGAAYCRGPAIVLPQTQLRAGGASLQRLVAHELFHVLSSHNPELKRALYATIGFAVVEPIAIPEVLKDRRIANPDAPRVDCVMQLTLADGTRVAVAPILIASAKEFDPAAGKSMFDYLQFRLMEVEKQGDAWQASLSEGEPRLIDPRGIDAFWKQIGRNTKYIIHPDEILADNFAHLVMETDKLPTPEIVEKMKLLLKQEATKEH
jgi:hypothetical protein